MPIGKLLVLPDVTSSANFRGRIEQEASEEDEEVEVAVKEIRPVVAEGDGDLRFTCVFPNFILKDPNVKINPEGHVNKSHSDGDHAFNLSSNLQANPDATQIQSDREPFQYEIHKWIKVTDPSTNLESSEGHHVLTPVFRTKTSFLHQSESTSETNIPHPVSPSCSSGCSHTSNSSSNTMATSSCQTEEEMERSKSNGSGSLENVAKLREAVRALERMNWALNQDIEKKNRAIQTYETSVRELSLSRDSSLRDLCDIMKETLEKGQSSSPNPASPSTAQTVLFTTTPESNQLLVGALAGFLGGYAMKHFGRALFLAVTGGSFLISLGCQHGFINVNWRKIQEDLGLDEGQLGGRPPVVGAIELLRDNQLTAKYSYALGGFLGGLCTGLLS